MSFKAKRNSYIDLNITVLRKMNGNVFPYVLGL